ncbi:MAG TPA: OmpA family protein, partial [Polyangiaceae bacterium]|nr:OmpA family protein [Polyangiaceae bacterium]
EEAGPRSDDPKLNGCPTRDRDNDQVVDGEDACPDEAGVATKDAKTNGCPPPKDADQDSILDEVDACPTEPGVATTDPKTNGCPPPKDSDADGIVDPEDACPNAAGPKTDDPKTNGCPTARLEQNEIRILEPVKFANNSARLAPESEPVLTSVMEVLQAHKEVTKLEVRGHTDSRGGAAANLDLSKRRAASVMKWLIAHGVAAERLGSKGFGQTKPIDSNDTEEGRKNNRRVEFRIIATASE